MSDYFEEMGWTPLEDGAAPNHFLHIARYLRDAGVWDPLMNNEVLPPPASKAALEDLKDIEILANQSKQCPVCLKEFERGNTAKSLPCQHSFHKECIVPWLEKTNSCPLCRYELPTDDEDYEMMKKQKLREAAREKDLETLHNSMFG